MFCSVWLETTKMVISCFFAFGSLTATEEALVNGSLQLPGARLPAFHYSSVLDVSDFQTQVSWLRKHVRKTTGHHMVGYLLE